MASRRVARERPGQTLQATALVHEAWLRLIDCSLLQGCDEATARRRFLALGARAMRQVLVDHARRRRAHKRAHRVEPITLSGLAAGEVDSIDFLDLENALDELEQQHPRLAKVAELRLFGGLTPAEIADSLEMSRTTVDGDWALARALLSARLRDEPR